MGLERGSLSARVLTAWLVSPTGSAPNNEVHRLVESCHAPVPQRGPSSHDTISHATVHSRADLLFGVKVIWESGIDLARLVECLYLFRRENQVEARKIILQLRKLSCPDDGDDRHRAVPESCQRDLRHATAGPI
jgi:hypothetical protein